MRSSRHVEVGTPPCQSLGVEGFGITCGLRADPKIACVAPAAVSNPLVETSAEPRTIINFEVTLSAEFQPETNLAPGIQEFIVIEREG